MGRYLFSFVVCLLFIAACGESESKHEPMANVDSTAAVRSAEHDGAYRQGGAADSVDEAYFVSSRAEDDAAATPAPNQLGHGGATVATVDRKVIYNASVDLVVDDFQPVGRQVRELVARHGGYVAGSEITGSAGEPRTGRWTIRVPVGDYDALLADAEGLGQVREVKSSSREVTAEFIDLQARIRSKAAEETRLLAHLESAINLDNTLRIEQELTRVRSEIERLQGRLTVLADLTSLSTVTLTVSEIKDYTPAPTQEPGYTAQLGRAWSGSVAGLGEFLTAASVVLVTLTPWLVVVIPATALGYAAVRRHRRALR